MSRMSLRILKNSFIVVKRTSHKLYHLGVCLLVSVFESAVLGS